MRARKCLPIKNLNDLRAATGPPGKSPDRHCAVAIERPQMSECGCIIHGIAPFTHDRDEFIWGFNFRKCVVKFVDDRPSGRILDLRRPHPITFLLPRLTLKRLAIVAVTARSSRECWRYPELAPSDRGGQVARRNDITSGDGQFCFFTSRTEPNSFNARRFHCSGLVFTNGNRHVRPSCANKHHEFGDESAIAGRRSLNASVCVENGEPASCRHDVSDFALC
jgi:hypothetical protein